MSLIIQKDKPTYNIFSTASLSSTWFLSIDTNDIDGKSFFGMVSADRCE